jgi:cell division septation protein DedD
VQISVLDALHALGYRPRRCYHVGISVFIQKLDKDRERHWEATMAGLSGKKGKELLTEVIYQLQAIDPRIVPFDSPDIEDLELGVAQAVRDVFGSSSAEYDEFEAFKISDGPISRADSRTEKQAKYETGLSRATTKLEELLELIVSTEEAPELIQEIAPDDLMEVDPLPPEKAIESEPIKSEPIESEPAKPKAVKPDPSKSAAKPKEKATEPKPAAKPAPKAPPQAPTEFAAIPEAASGAPKPAAKPEAEPKALAAKQPGKVLIISAAGEEISSSVQQLLDRLGIVAEVPGQDPASLAMESLASVDHVAFTLMILTGGQKSGLSGLTSAIGMGRSNHELAYKLGFFVGRLGPGAAAVLFEGDRPADLPEQLFGVRYIQYQEEGGWQIGLLKLLKSNGFFIDANLLFE